MEIARKESNGAAFAFEGNNWLGSPDYQGHYDIVFPECETPDGTHCFS